MAIYLKMKTLNQILHLCIVELALTLFPSCVASLSSSSSHILNLLLCPWRLSYYEQQPLHQPQRGRLNSGLSLCTKLTRFPHTHTDTQTHTRTETLNHPHSAASYSIRTTKGTDSRGHRTVSLHERPEEIESSQTHTYTHWHTHLHRHTQTTQDKRPDEFVQNANWPQGVKSCCDTGSHRQPCGESERAGGTEEEEEMWDGEKQTEREKEREKILYTWKSQRACMGMNGEMRSVCVCVCVCEAAGHRRERQRQQKTIRKKTKYTAVREREREREREMETRRRRRGFYYTTCAVDRWRWIMH